MCGVNGDPARGILALDSNADALRLAMLCLVPTGLWAAAHLYLAARDITRDQERARSFPF